MESIEELNKKFLQKKKANSLNRDKPLTSMEKLAQECFNKAKQTIPVKVKEDKGYKVLKTLPVPKRYKTAKLSDYSFNDAKLNKYIELLKKATDYGRGLNLLGTNGTGKTRFVYAFIREYVLVNSDEHFEHCKKDIKVIKDLEFRRKCNEYVKSKGSDIVKYNLYFDRLKKIDLLIIDDLFKMQPSDTHLSLILEIMDYRYDNMKPTIINSNLEENEMIEVAGKTFWDRVGNVNHTIAITIDSLRSKFDNVEF